MHVKKCIILGREAAEAFIMFCLAEGALRRSLEERLTKVVPETTCRCHKMATYIYIYICVCVCTYIYYIYYKYLALGPVWAETRVQSGDWYGSGTLHPGQVLRGSLLLLSLAF